MKWWVVLLCLLALVACGQTRLTAAPIPSGWQPAQAGNVTLALPPSWHVITPDKIDASGGLATLATANPALGPLLGRAGALFASNRISLLAYDADPSTAHPDFTTNLELGTAPAAGAALASLRAANMTQLQSTPTVSGLTSTNTNIAGLPAVQFSYGLELQTGGSAPVSLRVAQFLWVAGSNQYLLTFTTTVEQYPALEPVAKTIVTTVRSTP